MQTVTSILNTAAAITIALSLFYYLAMMLAGLRNLRRDKVPLSIQGDTKYELPFQGRTPAYDLYFLIPGLNEAAVIENTIRLLANQPRATVIMIDDGSEDATGDLAQRAGGPSTIVVRRTLPEARQGKGEALNAGYRILERLVEERKQDPNRVLVCVMDADGRLSDGALARIEPLFDDPSVGGVQLAVRIRNRDTNFLTRFQDFQFWSMSAVSQFGRKTTQTVSLGGNGQFTRLTALRQAGEQPWSASLTEDLDLAISLITNGWALQTTPEASVDQQAVVTLKRLFVQRRRWYQGHMTAGSRIGKIWGEPSISHLQALEISGYLAVPWIFDLPWSILSHWTLVSFIVNAPSVFAYVTGPISLVVGVFFWYLLTFAPAILTTTIYFRRDRRTGFWRSFLMGHSFLIMNYLSYACVWAALFRILRGHTGWDKTVRVVESEPAHPEEAALPASSLPIRHARA